MPEYHLAQLNVGRMLAPLDSPQLAGFVAALDPINALADASPGFVWRLQTEEGNATALKVDEDDDLFIVNLSVWENLEALSAFVYDSAHREVLRQRAQWFERMRQAYLVLWWVRAGAIPTVAEALARLELVREDGPTAEAFTLRHPFPSPAATISQ